MNALAQTVVDYGWWLTGLMMLMLEVVVPGVYLVFFGIAALIVGTNAFLLAQTGWFGFGQQVIAFIVLSAVCIYLGRRWYGSNDGIAGDTSPLNRRTSRLIGREARLSDAIVDGRGRIALEDSWWSVAGPDLRAGTRVRITGADGAVLKVEPIE
ncbi:NfeD family protein [Jiella sp. MQZ9-1]|uniref:NfeD family protein n=1 Tax=Jiella flava TaxID=2816857 RepID=A0A939FY14_9HYPH|nr:NfeD family protein [Jiella flava]MBO0663615.1 NfeD family protein [Jiella flava]MCD2472190.1 NfeD family protein [Jiella flava]